MNLTERFEVLLKRLTTMFIAYDDTPRSPDRVAELGRARWDLEEARVDIADERVAITSANSNRIGSKTAIESSDIAVINVQGMIGN